jgi:hypothetical protein
VTPALGETPVGEGRGEGRIERQNCAQTLRSP